MAVRGAWCPGRGWRTVLPAKPCTDVSVYPLTTNVSPNINT